jgi:hypothetical protein
MTAVGIVLTGKAMIGIPMLRFQTMNLAISKSNLDRHIRSRQIWKSEAVWHSVYEPASWLAALERQSLMSYGGLKSINYERDVFHLPDISL